MTQAAIRGLTVSMILGLFTVSLAQDNPPTPDPLAQLQRELEQARREIAEARAQAEQSAQMAARAREQIENLRNPSRQAERDDRPEADRDARDRRHPDDQGPGQRERLRDRIRQLENERNALRERGADPDQIGRIDEELRRVMADLRGPEQPGRGDRREEHRPDVHARFQQKRQRLEHLRAASEHLAAAELSDLAREVRHRADELERDLQAERTRLEDSRDHGREANAPPRRDIHRELDELRQELRNMRREFHDQTRSPSNPPER